MIDPARVTRRTESGRLQPERREKPFRHQFLKRLPRDLFEHRSGDREALVRVDGTTNGLEYALRRQPGLSDTPLSPTLSGPAGAHVFTLRYRAAARDLRYIVQRSADLGAPDAGWAEVYRFDISTGVITETGITADENSGTEIITLTDPTAGTNLFWRLRIELVP